MIITDLHRTPLGTVMVQAVFHTSDGQKTASLQVPADMARDDQAFAAYATDWASRSLSDSHVQLVSAAPIPWNV